MVKVGEVQEEEVVQSWPAAESPLEMVFSPVARLWELITHYRDHIIYIVLALISVGSSIYLGVTVASVHAASLTLGFWVVMLFSYFMANLSQYLTFGTIFEFLHGEKNPHTRAARRKQMRKEILIGIKSIAIISLFLSVWLRWVAPHTYFYGYYETHAFTWKMGVLGFFAYFVIADIWFYWSHRVLHTRWFFRRVHHVHHQFYNPTGFAQIAVHWLEAIIHGPCVYLIPSLFFPVQEGLLVSVGYMTGIYAIAAHDGKILDLNRHYLHHSHRATKQGKREVSGVNYGIFWGFWDYIMGTRYHPATTTLWGKPEQKKK